MKYIASLAALALTTALSAQTLFWQDDLENASATTMGGGTRTPSVSFQTNPNRYFVRTGTAGISTQNVYTGFSNSNFWAGENISNNGSQSANQTVTWSGINISGYNGLSFRGLFAIGGGAAWDMAAGSIDYMIVSYRIDGGPWVDGVRFLPNVTSGAGRLAVETTGDSVAFNEGAQLSFNMTEYSFNISGTGTTMDIILKCHSNANNEECAADNLRLYYTCVNPVISTQPVSAAACAGSNTSFSVAATNATSYQWQENTGSGFSNIANGGIYSGATTSTLSLSGITASMNGYQYRCIAMDLPCSTNSGSATLTVSNPALTIASQTNVGCNGGNTGAASVNPASGGIGTYTYDWTPGNPSGDGTVSVTGLSAGSYTLTATDGIGCTVTQVFSITEPPVLGVSLVSQTNATCNGGADGTATVSSSGGSGTHLYAWTPSGGNAAAASGLTAGTYTCTVTDVNGCTVTQTVTITEPGPVLISASYVQNNTCNGFPVTLSATGASTYLWYPGAVPGASVVMLPQVNTTYTVVGTDVNGCTGSTTVTVNVINCHPRLINSLCGASGLILYDWLYNTSVPGATNYQYTLTNTVTGQVHTRIKGNAYPNMPLSWIPGLLYGQTYDVKIRAYVNGVWQPYGYVCQITMQAYAPQTMLDPAYCNTSGYTLTSYIYCIHQTGASNFKFTLTNGSYTQTRSRTVNNEFLGHFTGLTPNTTYTVTVTEYSGGMWSTPITNPVCTITMAGAIRTADPSLQEEDSSASVLTDFSVNLYPNPLVDGQAPALLITGAYGQNAAIKVFDITGRELANYSIPVEGDEFNVALGEFPDLPAGSYFMQVTAGDHTENIKFIVQ